MQARGGIRSARRGWLAGGLTTVAALLWVMVSHAVAPARTQAHAPGLQPVIFVGTIRDSVNAPPPAFRSLRLVVGSPAQNTLRPSYCAIGSADASGNYQLVVQPFAAACTTPGSILSLTVNEIPAVQTTLVPANGGTYTVNFTLAVPLGGQPISTATQIVPVLQPVATPNPSSTTNAVSATPSSAPLRTTQLVRGCTQVVVSFGFGASVTQIVAGLANPAALSAVWRFDNTLQRFTGYF
ncbi:MAG: hypothetical protein ACR2PL_02660, partial [Dehalococcoidia bacterium]